MISDLVDNYRVSNRPISILARRVPTPAPLSADTPGAITSQIAQLGSAPLSLGPMNSGLATNPQGAAAIQTSGAKDGFVKTYAPQIIVGVLVVILGTLAAKRV